MLSAAAAGVWFYMLYTASGAPANIGTIAFPDQASCQAFGTEHYKGLPAEGQPWRCGQDALALQKPLPKGSK